MGCGRVPRDMDYGKVPRDMDCGRIPRDMDCATTNIPGGPTRTPREMDWCRNPRDIGCGNPRDMDCGRVIILLQAESTLYTLRCSKVMLSCHVGPCHRGHVSFTLLVVDRWSVTVLCSHIYSLVEIDVGFDNVSYQFN